MIADDEERARSGPKTREGTASAVQPAIGIAVNFLKPWLF